MADNDPQNMAEELDFDELGELFGQPETELDKAEKIVLTQNLEEFASCFPDWDLHPPVSRKRQRRAK